MSENTGPVEVDQPVTQMGATFAERKAAREAAEKRASRSSKAVDTDEVEDKAVAKKTTARKAAKKA